MGKMVKGSNGLPVLITPVTFDEVTIWKATTVVMSTSQDRKGRVLETWDTTFKGIGVTKEEALVDLGRKLDKYAHDVDF